MYRPVSTMSELLKSAEQTCVHSALLSCIDFNPAAQSNTHNKHLCQWLWLKIGRPGEHLKLHQYQFHPLQLCGSTNQPMNLTEGCKPSKLVGWLKQQREVLCVLDSG